MVSKRRAHVAIKTNANALHYVWFFFWKHMRWQPVRLARIAKLIVRRIIYVLSYRIETWVQKSCRFKLPIKCTVTEPCFGVNEPVWYHVFKEDVKHSRRFVSSDWGYCPRFNCLGRVWQRTCGTADHRTNIRWSHCTSAKKISISCTYR